MYRENRHNVRTFKESESAVAESRESTAKGLLKETFGPNVIAIEEDREYSE